MDYDAIIVGGGPAGLTAAIRLASARSRVLLLDRESFGGQVSNVEWIEDYPDPGKRVPGPQFAGALVEEAGKLGVQMELAEVVEVEPYSGCRSVACIDGRAYTSSVVILAGGLRPKPLGIPGEEEFRGKGVIHCAFCDAGLYAGRSVAVCGGGNTGLIEALYLAKNAAKVTLIEAKPSLGAADKLQEQARANPRIEIRCATQPVRITGEDGVTGIEVEDASGRRESFEIYGVLARVGFDPASECLGAVPLDSRGYVTVGRDMQTGVTGILAVGDIRGGSLRGVAGAVRDGNIAAQTALQFLEDARLSGSH